MSKAYSSKALPSGTVLREWRLEEVLGVGGFGIVYKGRGIYFDELVAIKEYFPSSISEREADDTVVPVDSDAEEVHALGLKKFVEEAKLLWNLSTPTRHPNIVSVRSLFEIHGTAYMVMDFEDGTALSTLLKRGTKFNERSLLNIIRPVAEGLERAHRVGVLHRDIKPPNILITEDGRPVLIDFGSARFEAAEATSTKVTFHTPPYAAIEQYVKTYPQGPWTDIYALGVVLYECVTGEKPPEVLERMHAGLGKNLTDGSWPGYTKKFLAAIDAAMAIRPNERPQSISEWLGLFEGLEKPSKGRAPAAPDGDATRIYAEHIEAETIVPIAPPAPGFPEGEPVETAVPDHPSEVQFKRAGQVTGAKKKVRDDAAAAAAAAALATGAGASAKSRRHLIGQQAEEDVVEEQEEAAAEDEAEAAPVKHPHKHHRRPRHDAAERKDAKTPSPALLAGGAVALLALIGGGWAMFGRGGDNPPDMLSTAPETTSSGPVSMTELETLAPSIKALADDASKSGAPATAVEALAQASDQLAQQLQAVRPLSSDPTQAAAFTQKAGEMRQLATRANAAFAAALLSDAETKSQRLSAAVPWANPANESASRGQSADRQQIAGTLRTSLAQMRSAVDAASKATSPAQSLDYARLALTQAQSFTAASMAAYNRPDTTAMAAAAPTAAPPPLPTARTTTVAPTVRTPTKTATASTTSSSAPSSSTSLSPSKIGQLNSIIDDGRSMARQVISMGRRSGADSASTQTLKANARLAQDYDRNLATLKSASRAVRTDSEADRYIAQAKQTRAYVQFLVRQSTAASK